MGLRHGSALPPRSHRSRFPSERRRPPCTLRNGCSPFSQGSASARCADTVANSALGTSLRSFSRGACHDATSCTGPSVLLRAKHAALRHASSARCVAALLRHPLRGPPETDCSSLGRTTEPSVPGVSATESASASSRYARRQRLLSRPFAICILRGRKRPHSSNPSAYNTYSFRFRS